MTIDDVDASLVAGVELLSLDAGNTVIFLDHARLARSVTRAGFALDAPTLVAAEGEAKRRAEDGTLFHPEWSMKDQPSARGWASVTGTMLEAAGVPRERVALVLDAIWPEHVEKNFWSLVPDALPAALQAARDAGLRVAIVSNSEGMLEGLFASLGILPLFDTVVDSGVVGVEKPDPRIFVIAMQRCGARPETTLHLGDVYATDTLGARAAGIRTALIDPYGHLDGRHPDVPRVAGAAEVASVITASRRSLSAR